MYIDIFWLKKLLRFIFVNLIASLIAIKCKSNGYSWLNAGLSAVIWYSLYAILRANQLLNKNARDEFNDLSEIRQFTETTIDQVMIADSEMIDSNEKADDAPGNVEIAHFNSEAEDEGLAEGKPV